MQAGDYDVDATVLPAVTRRVYVNGVRREFTACTLDAEISSDLPEQVAGVTGILARTGTVTFAPLVEVGEQAPSPLVRRDGWPPRRGASLVIEDATATGTWRRATASIDEVSAPLASGEVSVSWSDDIMSILDVPTTHAPISRSMPAVPGAEVGERATKATSLEPFGVVADALRDAGYRYLPGGTDLGFYAVFQGKVLPEGGYTISAPQGALSWNNSAGCQYLSSWCDFAPRERVRLSSECTVIYLRCSAGGPQAETRWTMTDGAEIRVLLSEKRVTVQRLAGGTMTDLATHTFQTDHPMPWVGVSLASASVALWTIDGAVTTHSIGQSIGIDWASVRVIGATALQVSYVPRAGWPGFAWPSLRVHAEGPSHVRQTACTRTIVDESVLSVASDAAKSSLVGFWLDEHGILQWVPSVVLEARPVSQVITTRADVLAGAWRETGGSVASRVVVEYDDCALTTSAFPSVDLTEVSQGGQQMKSGEVIEDWVGPGADEEWVMPDMDPRPASENTPLVMRDGVFSIWGGSYVATEFPNNQDDTTYGWAHPPQSSRLSISVEEVAPNRWKVVHTRTGGANAVSLQTLPNGRTIPRPWRGVGLPVWRGRQRAQYTQRTVLSPTPGPTWGPMYTHRLGAWGNRNDAQRLAQWLGERMLDVQIVLSDLRVIPDPRRQLGDVIEVKAEGVLDGVLRCLIVGIHESSDPSGIVQELDLRVIRATPADGSTYESIESAATYGAIESKATYAVVESGG